MGGMGGMGGGGMGGGGMVDGSLIGGGGFGIAIVDLTVTFSKLLAATDLEGNKKSKYGTTGPPTQK